MRVVFYHARAGVFQHGDKVNRAPSFQFYPDKWQSHTRRLSHEAYRVYHELLCWMWQSSPDYCSVDASNDAVAVAVAMPLECVRNAMAEIQNAHAPLLKEKDGRWYSNGLRKESEKQTERREKAKLNAEARWKHAAASKSDAKASIPQCSSSPTPSPSSSPTTSTSEDISVQGCKQPKRTKRQPLEVDKAWMDSLRDEYLKIGIDIDVQAVKAKAWLTSPKAKGRKFTRQYFLNWLSRCDSQMPASERPKRKETFWNGCITEERYV
jgi:uncharacterized protein YdaU (DUF1376 family)